MCRREGVEKLRLRDVRGCSLWENARHLCPLLPLGGFHCAAPSHCVAESLSTSGPSNLRDADWACAHWNRNEVLGRRCCLCGVRLACTSRDLQGEPSKPCLVHGKR